MNSTPITLLYVDDEETNLFLFNLTFKAVFRVITANSAEEALQVLQNEPHIDVIISDMNMPVMDGLQFLNEVFKMGRKVPSIILSGYERTEQMEKAIQSGLIQEYVSKPYEKEQLQSLVEQMASGK